MSQTVPDVSSVDVSPYEQMVRKIAEECRIIDSSTLIHSELGKLRPPRDLETDADYPVMRHLWRVIYLHYYAGDAAATRLFLDGGQAVAAISDHEDYDLVEQYEAAHHCRGYWTSGWTIKASSEAGALVSKEGVTVQAPLSRVRLGPDQTAEVRMPPARRYAVMGWYSIVGDAGPVDRQEQNIRLYITLKYPEAGIKTLGSITRFLRQGDVKYQYKLVNHPDAFLRRDNSVLYLPAEVWSGPLQNDLLSLLSDEKGNLRDDSPCFAKKLIPGVAFAVEPAAGSAVRSFGEHRCQLVAQGLIEAFRVGEKTSDGKVAIVRQEFEAAGLSLDRPFEGRDAA
ncbi:T3SS effector HopA1 family protein [Streptomyces sp. NPDC059452]|uniref:T3SS effector HopA1 family protein n=1 Tax=Streptomyces sp. NPDC059452 TaxID=3346835 RepID=UPI0036C0A8E5